MKNRWVAMVLLCAPLCAACASPLEGQPGGAGGAGAAGGVGGEIESGGGGAGGAGGEGGGGAAPAHGIHSVTFHADETTFAFYNTMFVLREGKPACGWGGNIHGQLGTGTNTASYWAVPVSEIGEDIEEVRPGSRFTCARTTPGDVYCWGYPTTEQLGLGDVGSGDVLSPKKLAGIEKARGLAVDEGSCAWTEDGSVYCWGPNTFGQAGVGHTEAVLSPVKVSGLPKVIFVDTRRGATCALAEDGAVWCWGYNAGGKLDIDDPAVKILAPKQVPAAGTDNVALSVGSIHECVLKADARAFCWGLGIGPQPVHILPGTDVLSVAAGDGATCVVAASGDVHCWGENYVGQLGDGTFDDKNLVTGAVLVTNDATEVWSGHKQFCARKTSGKVVCWGLLPVDIDLSLAFTPPVELPDDFVCDGTVVPPLKPGEGKETCGFDCPPGP